MTWNKKHLSKQVATTTYTLDKNIFAVATFESLWVVSFQTEQMFQLSRFSIYPPGLSIRIKISRIFQKKKRKINSHNKKIFCITKYCSIVCSFLYLLNSFEITNRQNNKRDVRLLWRHPLKYFSLFIYNNCITLHLAWLV